MGNDDVIQQSVHPYGRFPATYLRCSDDILTKYDLKMKSIIGVSSTGTVLLVETPSRNPKKIKQEAIKLYKKKLPNHPHREKFQLGSFLTEVGILQHVNHRYIISINMALDCPEEYVVCTDYFPCGDLRSMLASISLAVAGNFLTQLASALCYLHSQRIVHRDIKPENVLVHNNTEIRLIDFGLSCTVHPECRGCGARTGTKNYMAPELLDGTVDIDLYKCDIYSVGVVLWNMVSHGFFPPTNDQIEDFKNLEVPNGYRLLLQNLLHHDHELRMDSKNLLLALRKSYVRKNNDNDKESKDQRKPIQTERNKGPKS